MGGECDFWDFLGELSSSLLKVIPSSNVEGKCDFLWELPSSLLSSPS